MNRFLTCAALAVCALGGLAAAQQQPVFRGGSAAVRVFATVTDKSGKLVTALAQDSFEVRDEGKPQPITQFDNSPQPIRLIVMLDVSTSMEGNIELLRLASAQLFRRLLKEDVARVGSFGKQIVISPSFTRDPAELEAALPTMIAPDAPTPLWQGVDQAIGAFGDGDTRKVILVLSDGKDTGPISFRVHPVSQAEVIDRALREDVMIYAVGMRSRTTHRPPPGGMGPGMGGPGGLQAALLADMPDPGLARVAEETGGGYIEIRFGEDLGAAFAGVADELHTQYLLAFAPPRRDGKVHNVSVKVNQGGLKARARKSYVAPKE
jgi:VWFA-related protein